MGYRDARELSVLIGKRIVGIEGGKDSDELIFRCADGTAYKMFHVQRCCENVIINDICGDLSDLLDSDVLLAEEVSNSEPPLDPTDEKYGSYTWTFYKIATMKGAVTIRWYGTSNGYYSEGVDFEEIIQ